MDDRLDRNSHYYRQLVPLPYSVANVARSELNYPVVDLFSDCCPPDISATRFRAIVMVFLTAIFGRSCLAVLENILTHYSYQKIIVDRDRDREFFSALKVECLELLIIR